MYTKIEHGGKSIVASIFVGWVYEFFLILEPAFKLRTALLKNFQNCTLKRFLTLVNCIMIANFILLDVKHHSQLFKSHHTKSSANLIFWHHLKNCKERQYPLKAGLDTVKQISAIGCSQEFNTKSLKSSILLFKEEWLSYNFK